jgi:hypothetical protein
MNFCQPDIEDYNPRLCGTDFAGLIGIGLINVNENPSIENLQDPAFWMGVTSAVDKKYFVIRNTRGEYPGGQTVEEDDLIGIRVVDATHEATFDSTGLKENWEYWEYVNRHAWKVCLVTSGGLLYYIDKPVTPYTKVNNAKSIKSMAFYESHLKWHDLSNPFILEAPEGIFSGTEPIIGAGIFDYTFDFTFN